MRDPFEVMTDQPWEVQQSPPANDVVNPFESLASSTAQRRRDSFNSASTRSRSLSASTDNNLDRQLSASADSSESAHGAPTKPWRRKSSFIQRDHLIRQTSPQQLQTAADLVRPQSLQPRRNSRNRHSLMMTTAQPVTPGMIYETPSSSSSSLPLHPPQPAFLGKAKVLQPSSEDLWSLGSEGNPNDETPLQTARRQSRMVDKRRDSYHQGLPTEVIWPISMPDEDFTPQARKSKSTVSIPSLSRRSSKISLSKKISRKSSNTALASNGLTMSPTSKTDQSRATSIALSSAHSSTTSLHMQQSLRGSKPPSTYSRDFLSSLAPREGGYAIAAQIGNPGNAASLNEGKRKSYHEGRAPVSKSGTMRWSLDGEDQYGRSPYTSRPGSEHSINTSSNLSTQPPIIPGGEVAPVETLVTPTSPILSEPMLPAGASPPSMQSTSRSSIPSEAVATPPSVPSPLAPAEASAAVVAAPPPMSKKELKAKAKADAQVAAREKAETARQAAKAKAEAAQNEIKRKETEKRAKEDAKRQAKIDKQRAKDDAKRSASKPPPAPAPVPVRAAAPKDKAQPPQKPPMQKKASFFGSIRKRFMSGDAAPPMPVSDVAASSASSVPSASAPAVRVSSAANASSPAFASAPGPSPTPAPVPVLAPAFDYPSPPRSPPRSQSLSRLPSPDAQYAAASPPQAQSMSRLPSHASAVSYHAPGTPQSLARSLSKDVPATPPSLARSLSKDVPATPSEIPLPVSRATTRASHSPSRQLPSPARQLPSPPSDLARARTTDSQRSARRVSGPRVNPLAHSPSIKRDYHDSSSGTSDSIVTPFSSAPSSHDPASDTGHDPKEPLEAVETVGLRSVA